MIIILTERFVHCLVSLPVGVLASCRLGIGLAPHPMVFELWGFAGGTTGCYMKPALDVLVVGTVNLCRSVGNSYKEATCTTPQADREKKVPVIPRLSSVEFELVEFASELFASVTFEIKSDIFELLSVSFDLKLGTVGTMLSSQSGQSSAALPEENFSWLSHDKQNYQFESGAHHKPQQHRPEKKVLALGAESQHRPKLH